MPAHSFEPIRGKIERFSFSSLNLENQIGDPLEREVMVHIPPNATGKLPCIIYLAPFTGTGFARANWKAFGETLPQRHERLVKDGLMEPSILVMPDTFTSLGGNQFVDSAIVGDWGTWLNTDLRNEISSRYDVSGFGLVGKSSGGYGALVRGMLDDCWAAVACHSGDCGFEILYGIELPNTLTQIKPHGGGDGFLSYVKNSNSLRSADFHTLMILAMAATYSDGTLPTDENCIFDDDKWSEWKSWDPLNMIEDHQNLPSCWIDVGDSDQYNIQYGLRQLHNRMMELDIGHEWEEFPGTHSGIDHRLDLSLPWMASKIQSTS
ncbi:MAG: enterochelin esterase [Euryarchaeota archaeon]|nr:enterochelin esterase [Euryarchaeota archaeon]